MNQLEELDPPKPPPLVGLDLADEPDEGATMILELILTPAGNLSTTILDVRRHG